MDTVVTTMTSTEGQLKELEKQALQLQRIAEEEAQAKAAQEAAAQKQAEQAAKSCASSASTSTCRASCTSKQWWTSSKRRA